MQFLDSLFSKLAGRREERAATFAELARAIADGQEPKVEAVEKALLAAGKSPAELRAVVEGVVRRRQLAAVVADRTAAVAEMHAVQVEIVATEAKCAEARRKLDAEYIPRLALLQQRAASARCRVDRAAKARQDLRSCADDTVSAARREVQARRQAAFQARDRVANEVRFAESHARHLAGLPEDARERAGLADAEAQAEQGRQALAQADADLARLDQEVAAAEDAMLAVI